MVTMAVFWRGAETIELERFVNLSGIQLLKQRNPIKLVKNISESIYDLSEVVRKAILNYVCFELV